MRTLPEAFEEHITTGATTLCNCWKITRHDGLVQGFTDHDEAVSFKGLTYEAEAGFIGTESLSRIGLAAGTMEVHSALSSGKLEEGDLANGLYDNAKVELYLVNWQSPEDQHILMKAGNIGEVRRGELSFMAEFRGLAHHLQQPRGRVFQATCDAELGDSRCGVDLAAPAFKATASVTAVTEDQIITTDGLSTYESGWAIGGRVTWQTGGNAGAIREVKSHIRQPDLTSIIKFWTSLTVPPEAGDSFVITAGCDKRFATCRNKFANHLQFRGFPHIPGNDYLISSPGQSEGAKDGSSQNQ